MAYKDFHGGGLHPSNTETLPLDLGPIQAALGPAPPVAYAAAHAYPASVPAYSRVPGAERQRPDHEVLRLYVHIPFCNYSCSFCFFAIRVGTDREQMQRYVRALRRELEWTKSGTPVSQVFVGGGTPTALPPELLDETVSAVFQRLPSGGSSIHTVEGSPESITEEHLRVLRRNGVGRVSMGIQSLDEPILDGVHRRHSAEQALDACSLIVESGLILNVDLIYGLPGQTRESFRRDLEQVGARGVQSLTLYDLRLNERTPVAGELEERERLELASLVGWRSFVKEAAEELGFTQTRWHTFKRMDTIARNHERAPHFDSASRGYQLGIGMSATSHLGWTVYRNHVGLREYLERVEAGKSPVEGILRLEEHDRKTQYVSRSLGDGKPLSQDAYQLAFGNELEQDFGEPIKRLIGGGLVAETDGVLELTEIGRLLYDRVTFNFYPPWALAWLSERRTSSRSAVA